MIFPRSSVVVGHALLAVLLLASMPLLNAQAASAIRDVKWSPEPLRVGSPCMFTVELAQPAIAVRGTWFGHEIVFTPGPGKKTWYALAGIDVEASPGKQELALEVGIAADVSLKTTRSVDILPSTYKTSTLSVPSKFTEPDAATLARIAADKKIKDAAFAEQLPTAEWQGKFLPPVHAPFTETFGTRRVFNGTTASIHRGLDFRAAVGTPVSASNSGEVILAQPMFFEGGLVVINHGQQFMTLYMHLSKIEVTAGQHVHKGQKLGLSGATGCVTGPHLHMAARWQGAYVDPQKLFLLALPASTK
jgi:murein DD-endopeptidase MepM/ murein hydrolase activator NlpD